MAAGLLAAGPSATSRSRKVRCSPTYPTIAPWCLAPRCPWVRSSPAGCSRRCQPDAPRRPRRAASSRGWSSQREPRRDLAPPARVNEPGCTAALSRGTSYRRSDSSVKPVQVHRALGWPEQGNERAHSSEKRCPEGNEHAHILGDTSRISGDAIACARRAAGHLWCLGQNLSIGGSW